MNLLDLSFRYRGLVYRAHNPLWQHAPESGVDAARRGGRWNPTGQPALYTSLRFETAWLEAQQGFAFKTQPLTLCTHEVDCGPILDLTDPAVQAALEPHPGQWLHEDWLAKKARGEPIIAWQLVKTLMTAGIAGIQAPSQARGALARDINLVFWTWSRTPPTQVRVIDNEGRLARRGDPVSFVSRRPLAASPAREMLAPSADERWPPGHEPTCNPWSTHDEPKHHC